MEQIKIALLSKTEITKHHIFGHIHEDGGKQIEIDGTLFVNASVVDLAYRVSNNGQIIEL